MQQKTNPQWGTKGGQKGYNVPPTEWQFPESAGDKFRGISNHMNRVAEDAHTVGTATDAQRAQLARYAQTGKWAKDEAPRPGTAPAVSLAQISKVVLLVSGLYIAWCILLTIVAWLKGVALAISAWWATVDLSGPVMLLMAVGGLYVAFRWWLVLRQDAQREPEQDDVNQTTCMPNPGGNIIIQNTIINNQKNR